MNNTLTNMFFSNSYNNLYQNCHVDKIITPLNVVYILLIALLCRAFDGRFRDMLLIAVLASVTASIILK
jgi:hypothetical protein